MSQTEQRNEQVVLAIRETKRSFGPLWIILSYLMLGLPFLGRQRITISNERIVIVQGFWTKTRDDIEIFRIRDVVVKQNLYQRMVGIGEVMIRSMEGRSSEREHQLRGVADPVKVSETIRTLWNRVARPQGPAVQLD